MSQFCRRNAYSDRILFFSSFTFISFPTFFPFVFFLFILNNISLFSLSFHSKANIYILLRQSYKFREKKLFYLHCSLHWERKCSKEKYSKNIHKKYNVLLYIYQIRMMCVVTNHQNNRSRAFSVHWSHRIYLIFFSISFTSSIITDFCIFVFLLVLNSFFFHLSHNEFHEKFVDFDSVLINLYRKCIFPDEKNCIHHTQWNIDRNGPFVHDDNCNAPKPDFCI